MRAWGPFIGVLALWLGASAFFQFAAQTFYDPDEYFHLQMAVWMQTHGWRLPTFAVATESIWVDGFFDKDWLFHLFLLPFLAAGKMLGGKLAVLTLNAALLAAFWSCCRAVGVARPAMWVLLLPCAAWWLGWFHLQLCRPHLLGLVLLCLAIAAVWRRQALWLAVVAALWALAHASHWMLPFMILAYDGLELLVDAQGRWAPRRPRRWPLVLPTLAGLALGTLLHPQFPRNISGLFVQNVVTLGSYWQGQAALAHFRPRELEPLGVTMLLLTALPLVVGVVLLAWRWWASTTRPASAGIYWLALCTAGFAVLAAMSLRFVDYLAPFGVLLLAAACARLPAGTYFAQPRPRLIASLLLTAMMAKVGLWQVAAVLAALTALCAWDGGGQLREWLAPRLVPVLLTGLMVLFGADTLYRTLQYPWGRSQRYAGHLEAAAAVAQQLPPNAVVFTVGWDDPPSLWYGAPEQRYLVFLDPMFMYHHSPERFDRWRSIVTGVSADPAREARQVFGASAFFIAPGTEPARDHLRAQLDASPAAHLQLQAANGARLYLLSGE